MPLPSQNSLGQAVAAAIQDCDTGLWDHSSSRHLDCLLSCQARRLQGQACWDLQASHRPAYPQCCIGRTPVMLVPAIEDLVSRALSVYFQITLSNFIFHIKDNDESQQSEAKASMIHRRHDERENDIPLLMRLAMAESGAACGLSMVQRQRHAPIAGWLALRIGSCCEKLTFRSSRSMWPCASASDTTASILRSENVRRLPWPCTCSGSG